MAPIDSTPPGKGYTATICRPRFHVRRWRRNRHRLRKPSLRNLAVDTYRGFVMLLMMAEVVQLARVYRNFPGQPLLELPGVSSDARRLGGMLAARHDPAGLLVPGGRGACRTRSPAASPRAARSGKMFLHALWRSLLLVALGVFLRSLRAPITYFTFEDTLSQIGFGYPLLFLLAFQPPRRQWIALGVILTGYWLAWALYPAPTWAAHWAKEMNAGVAFDRWFLNLFPRTAALREQQRRIPDAELHPDSRHDAAGPGRRPVAARRGAADPVPQIPDRRRDRHGRRACCCTSPASARS